MQGRGGCGWSQSVTRIDNKITVYGSRDNQGAHMIVCECVEWTTNACGLSTGLHGGEHNKSSRGVLIVIALLQVALSPPTPTFTMTI